MARKNGISIRHWTLGDELPQITTREDALRRGNTYFFTGEPCKRGHYSYRYTSTQACLECLHPTPNGPHPVTSQLPFPGLRFDPRLSLQQFLEVRTAAQAYIDILQAPYIPEDIPLEIRKIHGIDHYPKGKTRSGYLYWLPVRPDERRTLAFGGEAERLCTPEGLTLPWVLYPDGRYGAYDPNTHKPYYILKVDAENPSDE